MRRLSGRPSLFAIRRDTSQPAIAKLSLNGRFNTSQPAIAKLSLNGRFPGLPNSKIPEIIMAQPSPLSEPSPRLSRPGSRDCGFCAKATST